MKNTLIISAYTCCGKTYASEHIKNYDILDVDICKFKTTKRLPNEEEIEKRTSMVGIKPASYVYRSTSKSIQTTNY